MQSQVEARLGRVDSPRLVDNQHVTVAEVEAFERQGKRLLGGLTPLQEESGSHSPLMQRWKATMQTPENKALYRQRGALAERPNAWVKNTLGLRQLPVRGLGHVAAFMTLVALAFNLQSLGARCLARQTDRTELDGPLRPDAPLRGVEILEASKSGSH